MPESAQPEKHIGALGSVPAHNLGVHLSSISQFVSTTSHGLLLLATTILFPLLLLLLTLLLLLLLLLFL